jgi:hypothetical protein
MKNFFVLRGPQGQLSTVRLKDKEYVAVWPDMLSALKYKSRHRNLFEYWAVQLEKRNSKGRFLNSSDQAFLVMPHSPVKDHVNGRIVSKSELFRTPGASK